MMEFLNRIYDSLNGWYIGLSVGVFIIVFGLLSYLGASHTSSVPYNMGIPVAEYTGDYWATNIANVAISVPLTIIVIWLILHIVHILFGIDLVEMIKRIFNGTPISDMIGVVDSGIKDAEISTARFLQTVKKIKKPEPKEDSGVVPYKKSIGGDVFHVSSNIYTYEEAPAVCSGHNATLATYADVEGAYKDKQEWCTYGWSDGQMALFPTQQETYDYLQKYPEHENDCGRPGVNGGRFDATMRFGVNCKKK